MMGLQNIYIINFILLFLMEEKDVLKEVGLAKKTEVIWSDGTFHVKDEDNDEPCLQLDPLGSPAYIERRFSVFSYWRDGDPYGGGYRNSMPKLESANLRGCPEDVFNESTYYCLGPLIGTAHSAESEKRSYFSKTMAVQLFR